MRVQVREAPAPVSGQTAAGFRAANYPIFRVNPAPARSLLTAAHAVDAEQLLDLAGLRRQQAATAEEVADVLFRMAPEVADEVRKKLVLPLRRAVHNQRPIKDNLDLTPIKGLPGSDLVVAWVERQRLIAAVEDRVRARHDEHLHAEREQLRDLLTTPSLARSLAMSSPLLPAAAERYCSRPWDQLDKRGRKSEQHLLRYGLRAGTKTSPFSQYTVIGYPHDDGAEATPGSDVVSEITLNSAYVRRLEAALRRTPGVAERLSVHPAVGLRLVDGKLIGTGQRDALGAAAADIADRYGEAQVSIPASPVAMAVLSWLRQQDREEAVIDDLVETLASNVSGLARQDALRFIHHLQDCGVLTCAAIVHEQSTDPLGDISRWLTPLADAGDSELLDEVAEQLARLTQIQTSLAEAPAGERAQLLGRSETIAGELLAALGDDVTDRPLPSPLWYEDARLAGPTPDTGGEWTPAMEQIGELLDIIHVFDEQHVFMRVLRHRFIERFGTGGSTSDLEELSRLYLPAYDDALQINEGLPHPLIDADPVLRALVTLRERLLSELREHLLTGETGTDLHVPQEWLARVREELPDWCTQRPASYAVFLQPRGPVPGDGAVLNKIYNGWGNYVSRFLTHAPDHVLDRVRDTIAGHFPAGETVAEFRPVNGFNANVHPLLTAQEIDVSGRPAEGTLPLDSLDIRHNTETDRVELVERDTGARVHPFYLGFLIPYYLPSRLVPLTAMGGNGSIMFEPQVSADRTPGVDRSRIRSYPRIVWRDLVIARRRWIVPADEIPVPHPGEQDADYFIRFNAWRHAAGLPDELFLHPPAPEMEPGQVNDYFGSYLSNRKPQYVAATGRLHCLHLRRLLVEQPGVDVVFEEALPAPRDALKVAGGRHTSEVVVDFYRTADQEVPR